MKEIKSEITPDSEKMPEYESPISYAIHKPDKLWEFVKDGTYASARSKGHVRIGPKIGNLGGEPGIEFEQNMLSLRIPVIMEEKKPLPNYKLPNLEKTLHEFLGTNFKVIGDVIYKINKIEQDKEEFEKIAQIQDNTIFTGKDIIFSSSHLVANEKELVERIAEALKVYRIYATEAYKANGLEVPPEKVVIAPRDRLEGGKSFLNDFSDLFGVEKKKETALDGALTIEDVPETSFEDIGGQNKAKEEAKKLAIQIKNPEAFKKWGARTPRAMLFEGDPGTGKTLTAKALAKEAGAGVIVVRGSDIYDMWLGNSEKMTKGLYEAGDKMAEKRGHCLIVIDEADQLLRSREKTDHHAIASVVSEFNQAIDGMKKRDNITTVLLSNYPENIDKAILSRCDVQVHFDAPQGEEIADIFKIHFSKARTSSGKDIIESDMDYNKIIEEASGMSGRDIEDVVQSILRNKALQTIEGTEPGPVTVEDITKSIKDSEKARVAKKKMRKLAQIGF